MDIAQQVPTSEQQQHLSNTTGRELSLQWSKPWQQVHVQLPWLSCQRAPPAEAAVLRAAKAVWGGGHGGRGRTERGGGAGAGSSRQQMNASSMSMSSKTANSSKDDSGVPLPLQYQEGAASSSSSITSPPPPSPPPAPRRTPQAAAAAAAATTPQAATTTPAQPAAPGPTAYKPGPLMLFLDTSALLAMLGSNSSAATPTCFTMKMLQVGACVA